MWCTMLTFKTEEVMRYLYQANKKLAKVQAGFMTKLTGLAVAVAGASLAIAPAAFAYGGTQTNANQCGAGEQVVNVTYTLTNDYDSGVGIPQGWANDTINRHLQVWQVGADSYCAVVSDEGSFVTLGGTTGPAGTGTLSAGITGRMSGGYRTSVFAGTLNSNPVYASGGQLGSFDLQCQDAYTCPGAHPTVSSYVTGWDGSLAWWGWQYKTAQNGTWTNSVDVPGTSQGNIQD